jgi:short-subunit dehydrogenase
MNGSTVRLSVVHPGGVKTNIARKARTGAQLRESISMSEVGDRFERLARTTPAAAAQRIIRGIERNEPRILIGRDAQYLDIIQRFKPATYWGLLSRIFDRMTA